MTTLRKQMIGELQWRNCSETTIHSYVHVVERFARFFGKSPSALACEHVKEFLLHLKNNKKVKWSTLQVNRAALRFLYMRVLKQKWFEEEIPVPKRRPYLPTVLSAEQITRMLDLTTNLKHWTIIAVFYGTGVRANELRLLKVSDIDSDRMVLHIREGKGQVPRDIGLSKPLLERLRIYWRWRKPKDWLFPSKQRPDHPMDEKTVRMVCRFAARRANIGKKVSPHVFRHYATFRTMSRLLATLAALPLSVAGLLTAVYHNLLYAGLIPKSIQPCAQGVPCTEKYIELFGFVSIPLLSLLAFAAMTALLIIVKRRNH